jgi:hypothetical protein
MKLLLTSPESTQSGVAKGRMNCKFDDAAAALYSESGTTESPGTKLADHDVGDVR